MRKLLCILLAVTLTAGLAMSASAAVGTIITGNTAGGVVTTGVRGINESASAYDILANATISYNNKASDLSLDDLSDLEVEPGDVIRIPLSAEMFIDSSGNPFNPADVSLSALNSGSISVRPSFTRGSGAYNASIGGNRNGSYIQIEFNSAMFLTQQRFTSSIYLARNGARKTSTKLVISGMLESPRQELAFGDDYADISDGSLVTTRSSLRNVELYLGDYCTITRNLFKGITYAGVAYANDDFTNQEISILNKHPSIQYIYKLKTVGLKTTGNIVTFDLDRKYYVYDANGLYINTSDKPLPYWTKYYLSTKKYDSIKVK